MIEIINYTVKYGDTLSGIAKSYYGDWKRYPEIMKENGMGNTTIRVGQVLRIPVVVADPEETIKQAVENCVKAVENLPEFKKLSEMMGW